MDNIKMNILSTTRLLASYNNKDRFIQKLVEKKESLVNRLLGKEELI